VLKPADSAAISLNEIDSHLNGRLLSCSEAVWRFLGIPLHKEYPPVMRLHIHLPGEQAVIFDPTADDVQEVSNASTSTLLQWFLLNERDASARDILYSRIPEHYVWSNKTWQRRSTSAICVGRTFSVSHHNKELFALRRLLDIVKGATGWADLLTVDGFTYSTFHDACAARGMLEDDSDVIAALELIVATDCNVNNIRREFALMLIHRQCQCPASLYWMFAESMCDGGIASKYNSDRSLLAIEDIMQESGRSLKDLGIDLPYSIDDNSSFIREHLFDAELCVRERDSIIHLFTEEQQAAMEACCSLTNADQSEMNVFCLTSSAGTGKSKFVNGVTWHLRSEGKIVLNVAASALAASVLTSGRTAHSCFGIPIPCTSGSFCNLKPRERNLIRMSAIIFYDEVSMVSMDIANAIDRTLRDIMQTDVPFGGKPIVFLGDFKQLLPVVPGSKSDNTVKNCDWWQQAKVLKFTHNFRAHLNPEYAAFLDDVGNGRIIDIPVPSTSAAPNIESLVQRVYGDDMAAVPRMKHLILALTLEACDTVNNYCLDRLKGEALMATAFDDMQFNKDLDSYPPDYIASLILHGVPPCNLQLKVGGRYMMVKNYDGKRGAINGTLCELLQCSRSLLQLRLLSGTQEGRIIMLPRCSFTVTPENSGLPFQFSRVQFPIIPAYCVTIHKAQGQSLDQAGLFVDRDCFAHGQLYTALSRVGGWNLITVQTIAGEQFLRNVVRQHILE
jgi:hypothetical protein